MKRFTTTLILITLALALLFSVAQAKPRAEILERQLARATAKLEQQIDTIVTTHIEEIRAARELAEMLERAHHNDRKVIRAVERFEAKYGPISFSQTYIAVFNAYVSESVTIDPIHICGQGTGGNSR